MRAARLFDGRTATAHDVTVTPWADGLNIRAADGGFTLQWKLAAIAVSDIALPDGAHSITGPDGQARLILNDPALIASLRAAPRAPRWPLALAAAVIVFGATLAAIALLPERLVPLIPIAWEAPLGDWVERTEQPGPYCADPLGLAPLQNLTDRLTDAAALGRPIAVRVIDSPIVNAFALPGDRVLVLRGLLDTTDGDELAGVLAHELGHLAHRDPLRGTLRAFGINAVVAAIGLGGASGNVAQTGGALLTLAYSREAEAAADAAALATLTRAGLRSDGLARFLARFDAKHPSALPAWLDNHPPNPARVAANPGSSTGETALSADARAALASVCRR